MRSSPRCGRRAAGTSSSCPTTATPGWPLTPPPTPPSRRVSRCTSSPPARQSGGLAAPAVFDPGASTQHNVPAMTHTAAATRHGAVTIAVKAGLTSGGLCEVGDVPGVVSGDITIVGSDTEQVTFEVLDGIVSTGTELVTLVVGEGAPDGLVEAITARIESRRSGIEVEVIDGGQRHYLLLLGAE
nr:hypothetical protein [Janibacter limosus]